MNTNHTLTNALKRDVNFDKLTMLSKADEHMDIVYDKIVGKVLAGKYRIDSFLDNGQNGQVY